MKIKFSEILESSDPVFFTDVSGGSPSRWVYAYFPYEEILVDVLAGVIDIRSMNSIFCRDLTKLDRTYIIVSENAFIFYVKESSTVKVHLEGIIVKLRRR